MNFRLANISYNIERKEYVLSINCAGYDQGGTDGFGTTTIKTPQFYEVIRMLQSLHDEDAMKNFLDRQMEKK